MAKEAEAAFTKMIRGLGFFSHKYGDARRCFQCGAIQPKSERAPDYAIAPIFTWVECKNSDSTGRWNWASDIGPNGARKPQRQFLIENGGWLFIELGQGRAPDGRGAWLIPFKDWLVAEDLLLASDILSLKFEAVGQPHHKNYRPSATEWLGNDFRLVWKKGGWSIPAHHVFYVKILFRLEELADAIRRNFSETDGGTS